MKHIAITIALMLSTAVFASAKTQPAIIFTQDVVAVNADGSLLPSTRIEPSNLPGMQSHNFDLGANRLLRIETNIDDAELRGLNNLAETVRRCYQYLEQATGLSLERGVLLYLVELEELPLAYSFRASYDNPSQWGEVRLALIEKGASLIGPDAPANLVDLLYDTLPHELGHDILETLPQLAHDVSGQSSMHTRWFIEGICEVLAKGFSGQEVPELHRQFLGLRRVDKVLAEPRMQDAMLKWAQHNDNGLMHESDLYGAAMLTMRAWTDLTPLNEIIARVESSTQTMHGSEINTLMKDMTGYSTPEMMEHAQVHGTSLTRNVMLAKRK